MNENEKGIIRDLAKEVAGLAALPQQEETRRLWRALNGLKPERPMVMIDQICWHEMEIGDELTLRCEDRDVRGWERRFRMILYRWRHFPVDMVVEPFLPVRKAIAHSGFGVQKQDDIAVSDPANGVVGHKYHNQFVTDADLDKIQTPRVSHDEAETARRMALAHDLFDGIMEVREVGMSPYLGLWDPIATWMSVQDALYTLVDRPEYMHEMLRRMTEGYLAMLDQLEEGGLLTGPQSEIHCTGAWTDELPAEGYDPAAPRTKDIWMFALAQMLGTVSPPMFKEFEVDYTSRICERFGLVYYGCCDPLDRKMAEVRQIPNVRKVSMSPWVDEERGAAEIGGEFVYSRKPNPAFVAKDEFYPEQVRQDLEVTRRVCDAHGCPLEFILKDISTVQYEPQRLEQWGQIAMEVART